MIDQNLVNELRAAGYTQTQIERELAYIERIEMEECEIAQFQDARFTFTEVNSMDRDYRTFLIC